MSLPQFEITKDTNLLDLFLPLPEKLSSGFILKKIGHIFVFFIFTISIASVLHSRFLVFFLTLLYAMTTEILQLFFMRDGRIFDIAFDSIGILFGLLFLLPNDLGLQEIDSEKNL